MNPIKKVIEENKEFWTKGTIKVYRQYMIEYFRHVKTDPEAYFQDGREYEKDIRNVWKHYVKRPRGTRETFLAAIKNLMMYNNVDIKERFWKDIARLGKGKRPFTNDTVPTNIQLKTILSHGDIRAKAMFSLLATSGMRVGEMIQLKKTNIDFDSDPVKIDIPREITKGKENRTTFCTTECAEFLKEWLRARDAIMTVNQTKSNLINKYTYNPDDERIFPFSYYVPMRVWHRLIKNAGFNERDNSTRIRFHKMHIHCLRKFAKTRLQLNNNEKIVNALVGHLGYLSIYDRFTLEQLKDAYHKSIDELAIFNVSADLSDVHTELREKDVEISDLRDEMKERKMEIIELRLIIQEIKNKKK